jgi:hypothetical protein
VNDVAVGEIDMCISGFYQTSERRLLLAEAGSFTTPFDAVTMLMVVHTVVEQDWLTAVFNFFHPLTWYCWAAVLGVSMLMALAIYVTEGDPCSEYEVQCIL